MEDNSTIAYLSKSRALINSLKSSLNEGLRKSEALKRLNINGPNLLPPVKKRPLLFVFLDRFKDLLFLVLLFSAVISLFSRHYTDAVIILIVMTIDASLSFIQVYRTEKVLDKIKDQIQPYSTVLRNGTLIKVLARDLVLGDIIEIREGEYIPADARLLRSRQLTVRESAFTGESDDVLKEVIDITTRTPLANRKNMLYMGTLVASGSAQALVVATGSQTELGKIAQVIKSSKSPLSPLKRQLNNFGINIGVAIFFIVVLLVFIGLLRGEKLLDILPIAMTLMVSAVPEDLTMILTIALTVGVVKILRHQGVVRELAAGETLGATTVICTDKTGTLTKGDMYVEYVGFIGNVKKNNENFSLRTGQNNPDDFGKLLYAGLSVLSDARLTFDDRGLKKYLGTSTEKAILQHLEKKQADPGLVKKTWKQLDTLAFDRRWKYKASLNTHPISPTKVLFASGAPDILLAKSHEVINAHGLRVPITTRTRYRLEKEINQIAASGRRVVGLAVKRNMQKNSITRDDIENLLFLGIVVISDPVRPEALSAISQIMKAGVMVKIVTGDHTETAKAIAREVGIPASEDGILTTDDLDRMTDEELAGAVEQTHIFSRVTPLDKQRIVRAFQRRGHIVAMTGDGVNDAVALKSADIGIAMGSGKDVAREAADLVLLNDSFATIVKAIIEGRILKDNLRKVISFLLSTNAAEVAIFFASLLLKLPLPLLPAQILWVNLVTDGTSDIALALEPKERNILRRGPEKINAKILDPAMAFHILYSGIVTTTAIMLLYSYVLSKGYSLDYSRTISFAFISFVSLLSVWSFRSLQESIIKKGIWGNRWVPISLLISAALQLAAIYVPYLQRLFHTMPIKAVDWAMILLAAFLTVLIIDLRKPLWKFFAKMGWQIKQRNAKDIMANLQKTRN